MENPCKQGTRAYDIIDILQKEKTIDEVVNEVMKRRPDDNKTKVKGQVSSMIKDVEKDKWSKLKLTKNGDKFEISEK